MTAPIAEARIAWAVLVAATAAAVLPDRPSLSLVVGWAVLSAGGAAMLVRPRWEAAQPSPGIRIRLIVLSGLLVLVGLVFGPSPALLLAMALGLTAMVVSTRRGTQAAGRLLDHAVSLGGALVVVLLPLELVLRIPRVAREFGLPTERARSVAAYDSLWSRNLFNFRSRHEQVARRPGVARVITLGDSFTWGLLIPSSDSVWPELLERQLSSDMSRPVEVINMGQRGWTTANEAELLRRLGWQFDPDLVIVQYYLNDAYPSRPGFRYEEPQRTFLLPDQFWKGYIRSSSIAALVSRGVNGILYGVLARNDESRTLYEPDAEGYRQLREAIREIGDSSASRSVPVLFVLYPSLISGSWTPETYPLRYLHDRIGKHALEAGLQVLDLTEAFAAEGGDWARWWGSAYDSHPSASAHLVTAKAIARHVRTARLLAVTPQAAMEE